MHRVFFTGIIIAGLLSVSSCVHTERSASSSQTQTPSETKQQLLEIKDTDGTLLVQVLIHRPDGLSLVPGNAGKSITAYYDQILSNDNTFWKDHLAGLARDGRAQADQISTPFHPYVVQEFFDIMRNDSDFLSIRRISQSNTGGVHEDQTIACETFRKTDGSLVLLEDLFKPEANFKQVMLEYISKEVKARQNIGQISYYHDVQVLIEQEFDASNFYLTDDSLVLVYPEYTLAPYAAGVQYFTIPLTMLQDIFV